MRRTGSATPRSPDGIRRIVDEAVSEVPSGHRVQERRKILMRVVEFTLLTCAAHTTTSQKRSVAALIKPTACAWSIRSRSSMTGPGFLNWSSPNGSACFCN